MRLLAPFLVLFLSIVGPATAMTEIQQVRSSGGHVAWLVEDHSIPVVVLEVQFEGGTTLDPDAKAGATAMMTRLLDEGAGDLDATAYAVAVETLASQISFYSTQEVTGFSVMTLRENLDATLELLLLALAAPRFDEAPMERVRARTLARFRSATTQPGSLASQAFGEMLFGNHPIARPIADTQASVETLTRQDLVDAMTRSFVTDRVSVAAVGAITADDLEPLLDRMLGDLPDTGPALPPPAKISDAGLTRIIPFPGPQSLAFFGHAGLSRDDPDFYPAFVLNQILGGGFSSRLTRIIRKERGLTYGVSTSLQTNRLSNTFRGSLRSGNETMAEALDLVRAEWVDLAENGVTEDELRQAKQYLTGEYALRFDGNRQIAGILVSMQAEGLPRDFIETRNDLVEAVTLDDIRRVAARLLDVETLTTVVVGAPVGMENGAD